eukprot:TRINITY_DN2864_c0_g1_i1.p1 TRINITY_DN2864_c0_g1~~TRINITY_DN2864_c0_g1_i1.p1  ORF type:complete len:238 (-),score=77.91 TRINITY_DN2864_c0_g1_i1:61-774(-)
MDTGEEADIVCPLLEALIKIDGVRLSRTEQTVSDSVESFFGGAAFLSFNKFDVYELSCPKGFDVTPLIGEKIFSVREESSKTITIQVGAQCKCILVACGGYNPIVTITKPFELVLKGAKILDSEGNLVGRVTKLTSMRDRKMKIEDTQKSLIYQLKAKRQVKTGNQQFVMYKKDDEEKAGYLRKYQKKEGIADVEILFPKNSTLRARILLIGAAIFADVHWFATDETLHLTTVKIIS